MSYVLFVNPAIVSTTGMPATGVFVATALSAAVCSILMGIIANVPFGMAPGMGLNTFFTYTICASLGFCWQEALALVFITGMIHLVIMMTGMRKSLVNAIPHHLKMAFGVGLGLFIGYIGLKNAGILMFSSPPGQYTLLKNGTMLSTSAIVPSMVDNITGPQIIALIGLVVTLVLLALEKRNAESYAALPIGILVATFVGIPMHVTDIINVKFIDPFAILEIRTVFLAFWGDPGLVSLFSQPARLPMAALVVLVMVVTNVMDSIGTLVGIGQTQYMEVFTDADMDRFHRTENTTKLDKALKCNALGGSVAALMGTTATITYMESITGIVAGGRTGLVAVTVGIMFLICLPLSHFFSIIPASAIAPALIVAGAYMIPLASRIRWDDFEEAFPAFITLLCIPLTYGFAYGIAAGVLSHVIIQIAMGKWRDIHPALYLIAVIFIVILSTEIWI